MVCLAEKINSVRVDVLLVDMMGVQGGHVLLLILSVVDLSQVCEVRAAGINRDANVVLSRHRRQMDEMDLEGDGDSDEDILSGLERLSRPQLLMLLAQFLPQDDNDMSMTTATPDEEGEQEGGQEETTVEPQDEDIQDEEGSSPPDGGSDPEMTTQAMDPNEDEGDENQQGGDTSQNAVDQGEEDPADRDPEKVENEALEQEEEDDSDSSDEETGGISESEEMAARQNPLLNVLRQLFTFGDPDDEDDMSIGDMMDTEEAMIMVREAASAVDDTFDRDDLIEIVTVQRVIIEGLLSLVPGGLGDALRSAASSSSEED